MVPLPTPHVGWDATTYEDSFALENGTWRSGDEDAKEDFDESFTDSVEDGWCDVDSNGQVDYNDTNMILSYSNASPDVSFTIVGKNGEGTEYTQLDAQSCRLECDYVLCMRGEMTCGLVGLEGLFVLAPLGLCRIRRRYNSHFSAQNRVKPFRSVESDG